MSFFPTVTKRVAKCVQPLSCNRMYGISGLKTPFSRLSPAVVIGESVLPRSILLIFPRIEVDEQDFDSIPSFNVKT